MAIDMTGLENILSQISGDAQREADEQLTEAKRKADEILAAAKEEANERTRSIIRDGEKKAQDIRNRAASAAQLEKRNVMLAFKQRMIREAVDSARVSLENASDQEYFQVLLQLAGRYAKKGRAEMRLNGRDLKRLPAGFEEALKEAAPQAEISLSRAPWDIENGFLLTYEGIDVNCTFQAIFEDAEGEMRDAVGKILFPAV